MGLTNRWVTITEWVLAHFTRPNHLTRLQAATILVSIVLAIGVIDYYSGISISLVIFYLMPIILACAWLGRKEGVFIALFSVLTRFTGDAWLIGVEDLPFYAWWNTLSVILVYLFIVWLFTGLLSLYRGLEQRVEERTDELQEAARARQQLEMELLAVGSRERNAFGQELHDDICQHLFGTAMAAKVLARQLSDQNHTAAADALAIVHLVDEGTHKTRRLARGLLLSSIDPEQLGEKLAELAEEAQGSNLSCRFRQDEDTLVADAGTAAQLFRIAQEALRNAIKHGNPRNIDISLQADTNAVCLMVEDDGSGLPLPQESPGMGLRIMQHRASYIGATLSLVQTAGHGTRVICHLPHRSPA